MFGIPGGLPVALDLIKIILLPIYKLYFITSDDHSCNSIIRRIHSLSLHAEINFKDLIVWKYTQFLAQHSEEKLASINRTAREYFLKIFVTGYCNGIIQHLGRE